MPTPVVCPSCGSSLDIPAELLGGPVRCANCSTAFTSPRGAGGVPTVRPSDRPRKRSRKGCLWGLLAFGLLSGFCCCGGCFALLHHIDNPTFQPYAAQDQSYTAAFPGPPSPVSRPGALGKKATGVEYLREVPNERFFIEYVTLTAGERKEDPQKLLGSACDSWRATVSGGKEFERYARDVDGNPAIDLFVKADGVFNQNNNLSVRVMVVGDRLYSVGVSGQIQSEYKHMAEFIDAFKPDGKKK